MRTCCILMLLQLPPHCVPKQRLALLQGHVLAVVQLVCVCVCLGVCVELRFILGFSMQNICTCQCCVRPFAAALAAHVARVLQCTKGVAAERRVSSHRVYG